MFVRFIKNYYGDKIKENGTDWACSTHGAWNICIQFWSANVKEETTLKA